jgi:hypothetical protein
MGMSSCRICGETLGSKDMLNVNYIYPEQLENYVICHNVDPLKGI